ncbi:MAG: hypothetical protein JF612_10835, partial [Planctomycetia bacterium]|nr:hypothetical protein [Planctomycetia bacterium]
MRASGSRSAILAHRYTLLAAAIVITTAQPAAAQRRGSAGERAGVYKAQLTPHWFEGGSKFWYQNELA